MGIEHGKVDLVLIEPDVAVRPVAWAEISRELSPIAPPQIASEGIEGDDLIARGSDEHDPSVYERGGLVPAELSRGKAPQRHQLLDIGRIDQVGRVKAPPIMGPAVK
jgi:hypothetical protein